MLGAQQRGHMEKEVINTVIHTDWLQIASLFLANAGLIFWFRSESRSDWRHIDAKVDAIHEEMKDFHGRMCAIEERRKGEK